MTSTPTELEVLADGSNAAQPGLLRALGPGMAMAMVVGNVIGSGIFLKPGQIAADAGDFSVIITAWVVGGGVCILGALSFAELAAMLPSAGGLYVYLREAYGRPVAFLFGWTDFLLSRPASIGALAVAFVGQLDQVCGEQIRAILGFELGPVERIIVAIVLIAGMTWVNIIGVIWGGRVQALTTLLKAGFLGLLGLLPFAFVLFGFPGAEIANFSTTIDPKNYVDAEDAEYMSAVTQFAAVMLAVMWAYNGWHGITPVAEEVKNPQRNIPWALIGGVGILIGLYVLANVAYHSVLTMPEMAAPEDIGDDTEARHHVPQRMVGKMLASHGDKWVRFGTTMISCVIMCSLFGAINSNLLNGPRVSFAMGRDKVFFRRLGNVHARYRTPAISIVVQAIMATILVIACGIIVANVASFKDQNIFGLLTDYVVFSASIFYVLAVLAVFVLRRKSPDAERPYRTLGYPWTPALYVLFYGWFLFQIFVGKPHEAFVGMGLIAVGIPFYFVWQFWLRKQHSDMPSN